MHPEFAEIPIVATFLVQKTTQNGVQHSVFYLPLTKMKLAWKSQNAIFRILQSGQGALYIVPV